MYHSARLFTSLYTFSNKTKDLDTAIQLFKRLQNNYKTHSLADDALYRIGEIYYKYKKDPAQAYLELIKLDRQFPSGDMRPKAKKMKDKLSILLRKKNNQQKKLADQKKTGLIKVKKLRHWSTPNYTRVVIDLDGPIKYDFHVLKADKDHKKPQRLYLDLKHTVITSQAKKEIIIKNGLLQRARAGQYNKNTVRVVLDMDGIGEWSPFHLYEPFRIGVDVKRIAESSKNNGTHLQPKPPVNLKRNLLNPSPKQNISLRQLFGLKVERIVIDPGHGGKDPGCSIKNGRFKEKDIVLNLAKALKKKIEKETKCKVFLTRNKDVYLSLEKRTAIANIKKADLFISLHVNAHTNKRVSGIETYFLDMAMDERSVWVAARENAISGKSLSALKNIINDLVLNNKFYESSQLAHTVQKGMISQIKINHQNIKDLGVKQAPFYVLIGAQMPSILVEIGFLTNSTEMKRLVSKKYQTRLIKGICKGIKEYVECNNQDFIGG